MNRIRLAVFCSLSALACAASAQGGRNVQVATRGTGEFAGHKSIKMAAPAESLPNAGGNNQALSGNVNAANAQRPKRPLTKEEKQALRRQINAAGGLYARKDH